MRDEIIKYIVKKYNARPEYLWKRYPNFCVFRHNDNQKWFGIIMTVSRNTLKIKGDGDIDIINVKTENSEFLRGVNGILPAYHMNKQKWITVLLDGTIPLKNVQKLIEMSFDLVG